MARPSTEQIEKVITDSLVTFGADADEINRDAELEALDIDSLDLAELSQIIEEQFGVELTSARRRRDQDRRRRDRPRGGAGLSRWPTSWSPGSARSRRSASARPRCTSAGRPASCGIADGEGRCREFDRRPTTSRSRRRGAPTASRSSRSSPRSRRSPTPAGTASCPTTPTRIGSIIGTGIGGIGTIEANDRALFEHGPKHVSPLAVPLMMGNAAAAAVSMRHGLRGAAFGTVSACSSGADAIGTAMRAIQYGDADAVVDRRRRGGADAALAGRLQRARRALGERHLAARSTRAATAS